MQQSALQDSGTVTGPPLHTYIHMYVRTWHVATTRCGKSGVGVESRKARD